MDSTIFQIFAVEEILERIGHKMLTGSLYLFNQKDSANLFFKGGIVVAASKGAIEGEDALRQSLDLKDTYFVWQANETPLSSRKVIQVNLSDFIAHNRSQSVDVAGRNTSPLVSSIRPSPTGMNGSAASASPVRPFVGLTAPTTPSPAQALTPRPASPVRTNIAATSTLASGVKLRAAQEEALLKKHQLTLTSEEEPNQRIRLLRVSSLVGRNPACDITLDHGSISRQHCLIQITDRGLHVKDLGSTNGTKVNGIALTEGYVNPGDKLFIGHLPFVLEKA